VGIKRRLRAEWPRAVIALVLATGLWFIVSTEEAASAWIPVNVALTLEADVTLAEPTPPVEVLVVGKRRELFKLLASPPTMPRAVTNEGSDSARLELRGEDVNLPTGSDVVVREVRPRLLVVLLRRPERESTDTVQPAR
jgi:hypothetical protein